ncbi:hypothetical protein N9157_02540 [Saprospiraceae bacterium]|jgi:hypothetical protein|nr:hypothetical protein [Saprospiraceae bacterium]|tara:strand:+ start:16393 stop:16626 length:234 start_codon:yes stop_codon:yes gene_type:complete
MPVYTIRDTSSDEEWDTVMSWSQLTEYLSENPLYTQVLSTPKILSSVGGSIAKTSDGWKDLTKSMHKHAGRESKMKI